MRQPQFCGLRQNFVKIGATANLRLRFVRTYTYPHFCGRRKFAAMWDGMWDNFTAVNLLKEVNEERKGIWHKRVRETDATLRYVK